MPAEEPAAAFVEVPEALWRDVLCIQAERRVGNDNCRGWRPLALDLAAYVVLAIAVLVALFPVFWTVSTSIKDRVTSFAIPPAFFDFDPVSENYLQLFASPAFQKVYLNTIVVTMGSTLLTVLAGSACAYALSRQDRFASRRPLDVSLILVRAIPTVVLMVSQEVDPRWPTPPAPGALHAGAGCGPLQRHHESQVRGPARRRQSA